MTALSGITQVALNLEMLVINAAIEAAAAKTLLESIESVNNNIHMSDQLEELTKNFANLTKGGLPI